MPFPPTFTNLWDITQPPDTQQANLLGQDIRNLKNDVMQRLSLLSGTTVNMPTPETVNATWGGAGFGLLFFATDTGKIWQWSGSAWVDVTANFVSNSKSLQNVVALATPGSQNLGPGTQNGLSNTLTGALVVGDMIQVYSRLLTLTGNGDGNSGSLYVNGTAVLGVALNTNGVAAYFHAELMVINATQAIPVAYSIASNGTGEPLLASVPIVLAGPNVFSFSLLNNPSLSTFSNDVIAVRVGR